MNAEEILQGVVERSTPAERAAFLDGACGQDAKLRSLVEGLFAAHQNAGSFLEQPLFQCAPTMGLPGLVEKPGTCIGPYKLLQQIGEGGMGVVYMAEQQEPVRRKVALKIIKPGMDSGQVIARFEAERQALAMMDHQNIARVLDAGTIGLQNEDSNLQSPISNLKSAGRPYFVMELVHGVPITKFCDDNRLSPRQRLELFIPVCQAVQHAHQKGIIHRDLKPSNILVTMYDDKPVPKVIDFGVAKAVEQRLTEKTLFTQFGVMVGTFEYMSPEQAEMNAFGVDTRSDIYSLGVLLYELLTGTTPLEKTKVREAALNEVVRLIKEEEPPRPSARLSSSGTLAKIAAARKTEPAQLAKLVRGELDWIVMKSLEKDRSRRYETANGMAQDVQRYLTDEPVLAGPPSAGYRLRKFVKRNRGAVMVAAVVLTTLLVGIAGTSWGWVEALYQRDDANQARRDEAEQRKTAVKAISDKAQAEETARIAAQNEAKALDKARKEAVHKTQLVEARLALERAMNHCRRDELTEGLLWLARGLEVVPEDETDLQQSFRRLLAGWSQQVQPLKQILPMHNGTTLSPNGRVIAEWPYTKSYTRTVQLRDSDTAKPLGEPIPTQPGTLQRVIFSPDSKLFATGCFEQGDNRYTIRLWEVATRQPVGAPMVLTTASQPFAGYEDFVVFSPDGQRLVTFVGKEKEFGVVRLWEVPTGRPVFDPLPTSYVRAAVFSPDSKTLLTAAGKGEERPHQVRFWDTETGKPVGKPRELKFAVSVAAFSLDGKTVVAGGALFRKDQRAGPNDMLEGFDTATGRTLFHYTPSPSSSHGVTHRVCLVAFGPDGKTILVGYKADASYFFQLLRYRVLPFSDATEFGARICELAEVGAPIASIGEQRGFAFSPNGKTVLLVDPLGKARLWDTATGRLIGDLLWSNLHFSWVGFEPDGQTMVIGLLGNWNHAHSSVRRWRVALAPASRKLDAPPSAACFAAAAFSPDGKTLAVGAGTKDGLEVRFLDPAGGGLVGNPMPIRADKGPIAGAQVRDILYSPDGKFLLTVDTYSSWTVRLWDAATHKLIGVIGGLPGHAAESLTNLLAFSPDSRRVLFAQGGTARLWDTGTGKPIGKPLAHEKVQSFAFSPDGKIIVTGGEGDARFWDAESGEPMATVLKHSGPVSFVVFSPDGKTLLTNEWYTGRLWNAKTGQPVGEPIVHLSNVAHDPLQALSFSPDSKTVLSKGGLQGKKTRLWDAATGKPRGANLEPGGVATMVSPDGKTIACGSLLYDAATGQPIGKPLPGQALAFSPDSRTLVLGYKTGVYRPDFGPLGETMELLPVPQPLPGDPARLRLWVEVITGQELDAGGEVANLEAAAWQQRRDRLQKLGGPPQP